MSETELPAADRRTADLIGRTADLLLCFSRVRAEWGVTELATALGMTKSRVHRIVKTLEGKGFLRQAPNSRRYTLGMRVFELGTVAAATFGRSGLLRPHLEQLAESLHGTISLRLLDGDETVLVECAESPGPVRVILPLGARYPIYYGAAGMAISSALSDDDLDRLVPNGPLFQYAPRSFRSGDEFRNALNDIRDRGYALSDERVQLGIRSVGVPIRRANGAVVGALVAGFAKAILGDDDVPAVGEQLKARVGEIARLLENLDLAGSNSGFLVGKRPKPPAVALTAADGIQS